MNGTRRKVCWSVRACIRNEGAREGNANFRRPDRPYLKYLNASEGGLMSLPIMHRFRFMMVLKGFSADEKSVRANCSNNSILTPQFLIFHNISVSSDFRTGVTITYNSGPIRCCIYLNRCWIMAGNPIGTRDL